MWAHTPNPSGQWHGLRDHLDQVAKRAAEFASRFDAAEAARQLGWAHDAGKADPRFQAYLQAMHQGTPAPKCFHAHAGAMAVYDGLKTLALTVAGHHSGLPNRSDWQMISQGTDAATVAAARAFLAKQGWGDGPAPPLPNWATANPASAEMVVRMLFSCLVDADRLDTELHFLSGASRERGSYQEIGWYKDRLDGFLARFDRKTGAVNDVRREILEACRTAAGNHPGVFTLTVPTGGGKTLSGLAFALGHAVAAGKRRVIVAIPYTSIIDQTASVFEEIFGLGAILEHHSAIEIDDSQEGASDLETRRKLASENWDCPIIVTTTVQLFESLLSNRPSRCRKLHNVVDSVIVVDEVQALPEKCLGPIIDVLTELVENYGCTVVLSTATPPDYTPVDPRLQRNSFEIVPDYERHFESLQRVHFSFPAEEWSIERVREELELHPQTLVILNTRRDALAIVQASRHLEGASHLSTLMCGHHRKQVLADVRSRLKAGLPVRLVSTQVVEAGVDVDFPRVYRVLGPLDRIVQAAGRCNREGSLDGPGECIVFRLAGGGVPMGPYATGVALAGPILREYDQTITRPAATRQYTRELYAKTETGSLNSPANRAAVQKLRRELEFKTVSHTFRMIEQDTEPVIVESYTGADVGSLIRAWDASPVGWFRRVSPNAVNLFRHEIDRLNHAGFLREHASGAWIYSGPYDPLFGLAPETPDPADLAA